MKKSAEPKFLLHLEIYLAGDDNDGGREPDFEVRLNFFSKEVEICRKNKCIAELRQKQSIYDSFLDKERFSVRIEPNVDQVFIAALLTIMDCFPPGMF